MSPLRVFAAIAALPCAAAIAADTPPAQEPPQALAAAKELFQLQLPRERWNQVITAMLTAQSKAMRMAKPDAPVQSESEMLREFDELLPYDEMVSIGARVMARRFEASEIQQISAFYRSPVGQKALASMPLVMNDAMNELLPLIEKRLDSLKNGHGKGPAAPPPPARSGSGTPTRAP
jgi:hypothetical protein